MRAPSWPTALLLGSAAAAAVVVLFASCTRVRVAKGDPTPLIEGFASFETPAQATESLRSAGLRWEVVEDHQRPTPRGGPPFEKYIVNVHAYVHHGCRGDLLLQFHNGRLMETVFFPEDRVAYMKALEASGFVTGVKNETGATVVTPPEPAPRFTQVRASSDSRGRFYVSWIDTRLENEYHDWISAYARNGDHPLGRVCHARCNDGQAMSSARAAAPSRTGFERMRPRRGRSLEDGRGHAVAALH